MDGILITETSFLPQPSRTAALPHTPGQASGSSAWRHPSGPSPLNRCSPKPKAVPQPHRSSSQGLIAQPAQAEPALPSRPGAPDAAFCKLGVPGACLQPGRPGDWAPPALPPIRAWSQQQHHRQQLPLPFRAGGSASGLNLCLTFCYSKHCPQERGFTLKKQESCFLPRV